MEGSRPWFGTCLGCETEMSDTWSSIQAHKKQLDSLRERLQRRRKQDSGHLGEARDCWGRALAGEGWREPWRKTQLPSRCLSPNCRFFKPSYTGTLLPPPQQHRRFTLLQVVAAPSQPGPWFRRFRFPRPEASASPRQVDSS